MFIEYSEVEVYSLGRDDVVHEDARASPPGEDPERGGPVGASDRRKGHIWNRLEIGTPHRDRVQIYPTAIGGRTFDGHTSPFRTGFI